MTREEAIGRLDKMIEAGEITEKEARENLRQWESDSICFPEDEY